MNYYTDVLKKYTVFSGRARRKEYWMFVLWNFVISIVLSLVVDVIDGVIKSQALSVISLLYVLAVLLPGLAVFVRRMHDTGRSGWWFFINLIPLVGWIVTLVFLVQDSKPGDNQYGSNPKGVGQVVSASPAAN